MSVFAVAIGGLLIAFSLDQRQQILSPGSLTSHHHTISDCSDCHAAATGSFGGWIDQAVSVTSRHDQNAGCQKCHGSQLGPDAMLAHGLSEAMLTSLVPSTPARHDAVAGPALALMRMARGTLPSPDQKHDCATCHAEHRGEDFDMKHLSDSQCQVCHASTFPSFIDGHPEFAGYPYKKKPHLYFDHASHINHHFTDMRYRGEEAKKWGCDDCHQQDLAGRSMLLKPFESTCASCHDDQIHNSFNQGIEFFALPEIDIQSLRQAEPIGQWPTSYPKHVQARGSLSSLTAILLATHPDFAQRMQDVQGLDLSDLATADAQQQQAVVAFVWSFKEALLEILSQDRVAFRQRVAKAIGSESVSDAQAALFFDQLLEAQQRWLPDMKEEIRLHRSGSVVELTPSEDENIEPAELEASSVDRAKILQIHSGWYIQDVDLSVRYRPATHADSWMRSWLDAVTGIERRDDVQLPASLVSTIAKQAFMEVGSIAAPGRCMKCHTVIDQETGGKWIRWETRDESSLSGKFTRFDHQPHLTGLANQCQTCHPMDATEASSNDSDQLFRQGFVGTNWMPNTDPSDFTSDFVSLSKSSCSQCHSPSQANDNCLTCHNYHVRP